MLKFLAEFLGTAFLLMIVVGSGIMGETLSTGNEAIALLANSLATGAGLFVLIWCLQPISGAHLNPVVSWVEWQRGNLLRQEFAVYVSAQFSGALVGIWLTHLMFAQAVWQVSQKNRASIGLWIAEVVATVGLLSVIALSSRRKAESVAPSVALYITSAYWFTASTSFANPAVTVARSLTDTFCGIAPSAVLGFVVAQAIGATLVFRFSRF